MKLIDRSQYDSYSGEHKRLSMSSYDNSLFVEGIGMKVKEFMKTMLEYIEPSDTVYDALERMLNRRIRSLVVKPKDDEDVYGVITARNVVFKVLAKGLDPKNVKVCDIASKPLICIDEDTDLADAATLMEEFNIARIFVCEGKTLLGIFSLMDALSGSLILKANRKRG